MARNHRPSYPFRPEKYDYGRWAEAVPVMVHDVAGDEHKYTLNEHGFSFFHHETKVPEIEQNRQKLRPRLQSDRPETFSYTWKTGTGVHVDVTPEEAAESARFDLGPRVDQLMKGRFQVIHAWRPLKPINKDPFTVAGARSILQEDLVHTKVVFPNREGSTFNVSSSPGHKFYYRFGQTPDIITLFKNFDSKEGVACWNPRSAFVDSSTVDYPDRESVECRAHVFHEPRKS
ncbi:hypothetical protein CDV31_009674 [Fusarium ambrosium]|uniref:Methyltransferase n=1 Tax=Fusarium ambrosium TaxID=131363 RepID=A0A428TTC0_9HYPO|nr:hypothetical protein CDV31_009674 [Fusarium ambrosium]